DRERGAREYESIRRMLIHFFDSRRCAFADELADDVIDRVARRLAEGEDVREPRRFFYGVAVRVWQESWPRRTPAPPPRPSLADEPERAEAAEVLDRCLSACLSHLPPGSRALLLRYYDGDGRRRIDNRAALARELGMAPNALRLRVQRLRVGLQRDLERRLAGSAAGQDCSRTPTQAWTTT
ncbi:MAG TPA: hypothetical protein VF310_08425, partial [Vicinamibacteria bacterium]